MRASAVVASEVHDRDEVKRRKRSLLTVRQTNDEKYKSETFDRPHSFCGSNGIRYLRDVQLVSLHYIYVDMLGERFEGMDGDEMPK